MTILTKTLGLLRKSGDEVRWPASWNEWISGGATYAGEPVNSESAMRLSAVYGSRRIIAYTIAGLPAHAFTKVERNGRSTRHPHLPEPGWLATPNRDQLWPEFVAQAVDSMLGDGNLFLDTSHRGGPDNRPQSLFVINPSAIVVGRRQDTRELFYATTKGDAIARENILHVRALTLPGHDRGLSPIEMARQEIGIGQAAQKWSAKFYVNGATVSALLEFPADMTREQVKENAEVFRELYTGSADKAHTIAAVAGATYKPMGITQQQAQFLESRQFSVVDIGTRIYGIPPHRLGAQLDTPEFGNSIEQKNMSFVQDAIMPWTTLLEAAFKRHILSGNAYLKFSLNGLLRGDAASRAAFYQSMRQQLGVFNGDDIAELEEMNPLPDGKGQSYWMPANTYLVGTNGFPILPERQAPPANNGGSDERKDFRLRIKALEEDGTFEGYAAVFGNVDRDGDVIAPSAFDRTVKGRNGNNIPVLWQHDSPAGSGELSVNRNGLYVKGKLLLTTRTGQEAYEFIKAGIVRGMSIGYRVVKDAWDGQTHVLNEIELFEVSLVTIPANPAAAVLSVKHCEDCSANASAGPLDPQSEFVDDGSKALPQGPAIKASDPDDVHSLAVAVDKLASKAANLIKEIRTP